MKILLLEDDPMLNEIIEEHLIKNNYEVISVFNGADAESLLYSQTFDLLLFDVNVPSINGFTLLKDLREKSILTPAIFITSLDMLSDVEKGFEAGCDDYIKKPFDLKELDLRINNLIRLFNINNKEIEISKDLFFDKKRLVIKKDNKKIKISQKEADVLDYLIRNKNKMLSVENICLNVWAYEEAPLGSTIRTYIKNLRKILGADHIINIRGLGYQFN
ncbi:MAG: DNA-binding response regulator [Arcobacter sp.]|nr:MAG: DNA-binding response regulator [Arcobacter sp.]